jgi:hypothetical protein
MVRPGPTFPIRIAGSQENIVIVFLDHPHAHGDIKRLNTPKERSGCLGHTGIQYFFMLVKRPLSFMRL